MNELRSKYEKIKSRIEAVRDQPPRTDRFERFANLLARYRKKHPLSIPADGKGIVLIAGTNGKGSVAKTLETCLLRVNPNVGLYTSPHMIETTERIRSAGQDLSISEFVEVFDRIEPFVTELSHFEILTLMMLESFFGGRVRKVVDRAIIEVGVGGRLDPTRVIPHEISVITQIGLDHTELLGETLRDIANEKFAIVEPGNRVIYAKLPESAQPALEARRREIPARYVEAETFPFEVKEGREPKWWISSPWGKAPLALLGERAVKNTSVALTVLDEMGIDVGASLSALDEVKWPCRMEKFEIGGKRVYLSGDHNEQGVRSLVEILAHFHDPVVDLVVAVAANKPVDPILKEISKVRGARVHLTRGTYRAAPLERYGAWLSRAKSAHEEAHEALRFALGSAPANGLIVVTGSLYMTGDLRRRILVGEFL